MSYQQHQEQAKSQTVTCAVITCSDSRTEENDLSGHKIIEYLGEAGHEIAEYKIIKDEPAMIRQVLKEMIKRLDIQAVIFNGGTGISTRDNTYDTVAPFFTKILPGFGELFRMLSYKSVGSGAMLSRAAAGVILPAQREGGVLLNEPHAVIQSTLVFLIPGSPNEVEIAMKELIVPELSH